MLVAVALLPPLGARLGGWGPDASLLAPPSAEVAIGDGLTVHVRALVLHGTDDRLVPLAVAEDLHRRLPRSTLVTVPGGSHMLPITHPELTAERIDALVTGRL